MALISLEIYEDYQAHTVGMRTNVRVRGTRDDSTDNASYSGNMTWSRDGVYQGVIGPVTVSFVAGSLASVVTLVSTVQAPSGTTTWPYTAFPGEVVSLDLTVANDVDPLDTGSDTLTDAWLCYSGMQLSASKVPASPVGAVVRITDTAIWPPGATPDHWEWDLSFSIHPPADIQQVTTTPYIEFTVPGYNYVSAYGAQAWIGVPDDPGSVSFPPINFYHAIQLPNIIGGVTPTYLSVDFEVYHQDSYGMPPVTYLWDFGDGVGTSAQRNPTYVYSAAGTYTPTCVMTDSLGFSVGLSALHQFPEFTQILSLTVEAPPEPAVGFYFDVDGQFVGFDGSYIGLIGDVTFLWDFGDGVGTSDYQWPTYTYAEPGDYLVTFTVTEVSGEQRSATVSQTVTITPPVGLTFTYVADGLTVTFTATVENPVPGYAFDWDFGDGSSELDWNNTTTSTVTHTYNASGGYDVYVYYTTEGPTLDSEYEWVTVSGPTNVLWGARVFGTAKTPV